MATKKLLQQEVAKAVGAGKAVALETVFFNDPNRPKTCIEVDFPILPVNQVAIMEGKAGNPIYQMSKWWARRRSSVFRSMLIAVATKAPEDKSHAAKLVWDNYYANHQKKGAFKHLKVADIFMGGGTTLVEGSRLGMQMVGIDFTRHNGKVYVDEGRTISVRDELVGINQLIDEDADKGKEPPPENAEPMTRPFLRTFGTATEMKRDQLQKFLRGTITTPDDFEQRGWCSEVKKMFRRTNPLNFARDGSGKHKRKLTSDLDQALVLIGAWVVGSGINASDTLKNDNFKPHVALKPLLEWPHRNGPDQTTRNAASRAVSIFTTWQASQKRKPKQGDLFDDNGEYA